MARKFIRNFRLVSLTSKYFAELLTQLSGVRRSAQELRNLQAQLQVERHKAVDIKKQVDFNNEGSGVKKYFLRAPSFLVETILLFGPSKEAPVLRRYFLVFVILLQKNRP